MTDNALDVRQVPPPKRHSMILEQFDQLDSGESLALINDHNPQPLFHQLKQEVERFDADGYEVAQRSENEFVALLPKK